MILKIIIDIESNWIINIIENEKEDFFENFFCNILSLNLDFSVFEISSIIMNEMLDMIIFEYYDWESFIDMKTMKSWDIIFDNFRFRLNDDDNDLI